MKRVLGILLLVLIVGLVVKIFIFEIPSVVGNDMAPTLQSGDRLLAYVLDKKPNRGELVLMEHPEGKGLLIRRVVGLPGDRIAVRAEVPTLNGVAAVRRAQQEIVMSDGAEGKGKGLALRVIEEDIGGVRYLVLKDPKRRSTDVKELTLGGAYYVLADHRNHATDSRTFGPVAADKIRAVITHRLSAGPGTIKGQPERPGWQRLR
jgi:signal peptidase I